MTNREEKALYKGEFGPNWVRILLALIPPIFAIVYIAYLIFFDIGIYNYANLLNEDQNFFLLQLVMYVGIMIWTARYSIPASRTYFSIIEMRNVTQHAREHNDVLIESRSSLISGKIFTVVIDSVPFALHQRFVKFFN